MLPGQGKKGSPKAPLWEGFLEDAAKVNVYAL